MGTISSSGWVVEFEDRLLTHLQVVVINRFRRGEPVLLSWIDSVQVGSGRSSIWLSPNSSVHFRFNGSRVPTIDRGWLELLEASASASTGLIVTDEHGTPLRVGTAGRGLLPAARPVRI